MRIGGRISAAIDILAEIAGRHRPASEALKDWGKAHRFAGSSDRHAIDTLVYDVLRKRNSLGHRMGALPNHPKTAVALLRSGGRGVLCHLVRQRDFSAVSTRTAERHAHGSAQTPCGDDLFRRVTRSGGVLGVVVSAVET